MADRLRVTIWNEFLHEKESKKVAAVYPRGIHGAIAENLARHSDMSVRTATLEEPEHGLTEEVIADTDVMIWWGHRAHDRVQDEVVARVHQRVLEGMGMIILHSGHYSKIFKALMGTSCSLKWREANERERIWTVAPAHPIAEGVGEYIELPHVEMYGERFDIPEPEQVVFISWFEGGEVFRSGCTWTRGHGRVFYFRPGHETYPIYHNDEVMKVIANAVRWARPRIFKTFSAPNVKPLEVIRSRPE